MQSVRSRRRRGAGKSLWRSVSEKTALEPSLAGGVLFRQVGRKRRSHLGRRLSMTRPVSSSYFGVRVRSPGLRQSTHCIQGRPRNLTLQPALLCLALDSLSLQLSPGSPCFLPSSCTSRPVSAPVCLSCCGSARVPGLLHLGPQALHESNQDSAGLMARLPGRSQACCSGHHLALSGPCCVLGGWT